MNWVFTKQERKKDFKNHVRSTLHNGGASQQTKKRKKERIGSNQPKSIFHAGRMTLYHETSVLWNLSHVMKSDRVHGNPKNATKKIIQHYMGSHGQFSRTYLIDVAFITS